MRSFKNESSDESEEEQVQFEVEEKKNVPQDREITGEEILHSIGKYKDQVIILKYLLENLDEQTREQLYMAIQVIPILQSNEKMDILQNLLKDTLEERAKLLEESKAQKDQIEDLIQLNSELQMKLSQQETLTKRIDLDFLQKFELKASNQQANVVEPVQPSIMDESVMSSEYTVIPIKQKSLAKNESCNVDSKKNTSKMKAFKHKGGKSKQRDSSNQSYKKF